VPHPTHINDHFSNTKFIQLKIQMQQRSKAMWTNNKGIKSQAIPSPEDLAVHQIISPPILSNSNTSSDLNPYTNIISPYESRSY